MSTKVKQHAESSARLEWAAHLHPLFVVNAVVRGALAWMMVMCAVHVLDLFDASDLLGWGVLALTTAGIAWVLLDDAFDIEGKVARQVAQAAVFDPDPFGARADAVWTYTDEFVRTHGWIPHSRVRLRQPDNHRLFRVYFPSRRVQCRRWCVRALLICAHRALTVVAVALGVVIAFQLFYVVAS